MRRVTDLLGMPVIPARGGLVFGTVTSVELDVVRGRICFLHVSDGTPDTELLIPWSSVCTIDARAITVFALPGANGESPQPPVATTRKAAAIVRADADCTHPLVGYHLDELSGRVRCPSVHTVTEDELSNPSDETDGDRHFGSRAA